MSSNHLMDVLTECFLCPRFEKHYAGRWDVWLIQNGYMTEWKILLLKTDNQLNTFIKKAKEEAKKIKESPLYKALS